MLRPMGPFSLKLPQQCSILTRQGDLLREESSLGPSPFPLALCFPVPISLLSLPPLLPVDTPCRVHRRIKGEAPRVQKNKGCVYLTQGVWRFELMALNSVVRHLTCVPEPISTGSTILILTLFLPGMAAHTL